MVDSFKYSCPLHQFETNDEQVAAVHSLTHDPKALLALHRALQYTGLGAETLIKYPKILLEMRECISECHEYFEAHPACAISDDAGAKLWGKLIAIIAHMKRMQLITP